MKIKIIKILISPKMFFFLTQNNLPMSRKLKQQHSGHRDFEM